MPIGYIRQVGDHPRPASRVDVEPANAGIAGAKLANDENNAGGQFTGEFYSLDVATVASADQAVAEAKKLLDSGHHFMLVDAPAETLLKLSDWAKGKDVLFFNIRATDVSLRQEDCRANIMHVAPDRYMLADALAQYLVSEEVDQLAPGLRLDAGRPCLCRCDQARGVAVRRQYRRRARI